MQERHTWIRNKRHLYGAIFSIPSSDIVETKATGRGTMPDINVAYNLLYFQPSDVFRGH